MNRLGKKAITRAFEACERDCEDGQVIHAFTWNPNPARYGTNDVDKQYAKLLRIISKHSRCFHHFCFVPELTQQGNIHIHGFYTVIDPIKYHKGFLKSCKNFGHVVIKNTRVDDDWRKYVKKDYDNMHYIISDDLPYPYTDQDDQKYHLRFVSEVFDKYIYTKRKRNLNKPQKMVQKYITDYVEFIDSESLDSDSD